MHPWPSIVTAGFLKIGNDPRTKPCSTSKRYSVLCASEKRTAL
ncbi:hypothetical protein SAMCCGM7_Ch3392 [Sinorhizobium americanum CCGM7]|nr:hypothetical protein SAMCCGM7_Ch3392 [Sinorhizobium americanum CCGM7]